MVKGLNIILSFILILTASLMVGCADTNTLAVSATGGTLGVGGGLTKNVVPKVNARVGMNVMDIDFDEEEIDDIEYDFGVDFSSLAFLVDWHIFDDAFHVTGGVLSMNNTIDLDARPTVSVEIGDNIYSPGDVGTLSGQVDIDGLAPYVGIGWGNPLTSKSRWGFTCDLGIAFTDSPDVSLYSTGIVSQADLSKEINEIEDDLDSFEFYPVIAVGFYYRF